MLRKLSHGQMKAAGKGTATAVFSRFGGPPDRDNDITEASAFVSGKVVAVSPWNHSSTSSALPAGKATIHVRADRAEVEVEFFLDTQIGHDTYQTLKALGGSEWSYAFEVVRARADRWKGKPVRVLEALDVFEVSPVLRGAGRQTETLEVRSSLPPTEEARREFARYVRTLQIGA